MNFGSGSQLGTGRRIFLTLFFLVFLGMGCLFTWLIVRESARTAKTWFWNETECRIISSGIREPDRGGDFEFHVEYTYSVQGRTFTNTHYGLNPASSENYGKISRLEQRYQPGTRAVCYVNGADPAQAVLHRDSFWILLTVFLPLLFVAVGGGGIYFVWRRKREVVASQAISARAKSGQNARFLVVFFLIFLLAGLGFLYAFLLRPMFRILEAKGWTKVPCTVVSSDVRSHAGDDGTTYSVNILYRYEIDGREYKANRYNFMGGSSSGYSGKDEIVRQHPPGRKTVCYVNPSDPTDAVLEPGFTPMMWIGLLPLVFVIVGAWGTVYALRKKRQSAALGTSAVPGVPLGSGLSPQAGAGTVLLKPATGSVTRFLMLVGVALFWNGIVSVFVVQAVRSWGTGSPEWFLSLFMVPFVLVGLGLIAGCGYSFLALFNPHVRVTLSPGTVTLGQRVYVQWAFSGRTQVLRSLRIWLEGREEATYRRGTTTNTDKNVFAALPVVETTHAAEIASGSAGVTIPTGLMHSFSSDNNKILWMLRVEGDIERWPDVSEEFPVTVLPVPAERMRT